MSARLKEYQYNSLRKQKENGGKHSSKKIYTHVFWCSNSICLNLTSISDKNAQKSGVERNFLKKRTSTKTSRVNFILNIKSLNAFPRSEQDKDFQSHFYPVIYW